RTSGPQHPTAHPPAAGRRCSARAAGPRARVPPREQLVLLAVWRAAAEPGAAPERAREALAELRARRWPACFEELGSVLEAALPDTAAAFGHESGEAAFARRVQAEWTALRRMCLDGDLCWEGGPAE
ncbi:unnamed protein product, partial [Prorocentrum cordatum]